MKKRIQICLLWLWFFPAAAWPDCVQVLDQRLANVETDTISNAVVWEAEFKNQCNDYVGVDLAIQILDEKGNNLYTLRAKESFDYSEQRKVENKVYVPKDVAEGAKTIHIEVEERSRL